MYLHRFSLINALFNFRTVFQKDPPPPSRADLPTQPKESHRFASIAKKKRKKKRWIQASPSRRRWAVQSILLYYLLCVRECMSVRVCLRLDVTCVWWMCSMLPCTKARTVSVVLACGDRPQRDTIEHFEPNQTQASFFVFLFFSYLGTSASVLPEDSTGVSRPKHDLLGTFSIAMCSSSALIQIQALIFLSISRETGTEMYQLKRLFSRLVVLLCVSELVR